MTASTQVATHDLDAEAAVLSAVMLDPSALAQVEGLRPDEFFSEPHRRIFEWALEQAAVDPAEVIHVGDHVDADVLGAASVGIEGVLIDRAHRYRADEVPDGIPVISSLDELLPIVDARLPDR